MGINIMIIKILEQKIQNEKSEIQTLHGNIDNLMRVGGGAESMYSGIAGNSKVQRKLGQMSSYLRKN